MRRPIQKRGKQNSNIRAKTTQPPLLIWLVVNGGWWVPQYGHLYCPEA